MELEKIKSCLDIWGGIVSNSPVQNNQLLNFQNLATENINLISSPLKRERQKENDLISVVFIRQPCEYLDDMLYQYMEQNKSLLFAEDIKKKIRNASGDSFIRWFKTLNFIPFRNPQTYYLDIGKRLPMAMGNLESFDYVVPFEKINLFFQNMSLGIISTQEEKCPISLFQEQRDTDLINEFVEKDRKLYERAGELWDLAEKNGFKSLKTILQEKGARKSNDSQSLDLLSDYRGIAGQISSHSIAGWVLHKKNQESVKIAIYKNDQFVCLETADKMRRDLKDKQIHPTGRCGFEVTFDMAMFEKGDKVEVRILPDKITLPLGSNVKDFLD